MLGLDAAMQPASAEIYIHQDDDAKYDDEDQAHIGHHCLVDVYHRHAVVVFVDSIHLELLAPPPSYSPDHPCCSGDQHTHIYYIYTINGDNAGHSQKQYLHLEPAFQHCFAMHNFSGM